MIATHSDVVNRAHDPARAVVRHHRERQRGDERELEARVVEVAGPPHEDRDRGGAERVDEAQRAIEHLRDQRERDDDQRAHRRELAAGDQRVRDREHERRRRRPPRGPHAAAPRRGGDEPAKQREQQARDDREVKAADAEHVEDADRAPALVERGRDVAAVAGDDALQRRGSSASRALQPAWTSAAHRHARSMTSGSSEIRSIDCAVSS